MRRKLEELNLLNNFLFGKMVTDPEFGEAFSRKLLKIIFQKDFGRLTVMPQKVYYGSDTDMHGTRLDVYLEDEDDATVYDVEPDMKESEKEILPKRVRFYHAKMDARSLKSGEKYSALKKVIVIMILPFDPFDEGRMRYTIRNMCEENPQMPYDDGAQTIFLYTRGKGSARELEELLHFMENTTEENAVNKDLADIQQMVRKVKQSEEVSLEYMRLMEEEDWLREQGRKEEQANTERERKRADAAEERADTAEERADTAEAEIKKLKEEIEQLKNNK